MENAQQALQLYAQGQTFDAIISDIELPGMNGYEFAKAVQDLDGWRNTPLIALSSHSSEADFTKARSVGFTEYVTKNDREGLLQTLRTVIQDLRKTAA